jgi:hypothetical protein
MLLDPVYGTPGPRRVAVIVPFVSSRLPHCNRPNHKGVVGTHIVIGARCGKRMLKGRANGEIATIKLPIVCDRMRDTTGILPDHDCAYRNGQVGRAEAGVGDGDMDHGWWWRWCGRGCGYGCPCRR